MGCCYALKGLKYVRGAVALIGFVAGVAFVGYGSNTLARTSESGVEMQAILTVSVGALLSLQSCCICVGGLYTDRLIDRVLDDLRERNAELRETVSKLSTLAAQYEGENNRLQQNVAQFQAQNEDLATHSEELGKSASQLKNMNREYKLSLDRSRAIINEMEQKIKELEALRESAEREVEQLKGLVAEQRAQIEALAEQAENLNNLQRQSVKMIQQLALYGDKAKRFGVSLADVSRDLRETDESLGLTSAEMKQQLLALEKVTEALTRTDRTLKRHRKKRKGAVGGEALLESDDNNV